VVKTGFRWYAYRKLLKKKKNIGGEKEINTALNTTIYIYKFVISDWCIDDGRVNGYIICRPVFIGHDKLLLPADGGLTQGVYIYIYIYIYINVCVCVFLCFKINEKQIRRGTRSSSAAAGYPCKS